jgi:hypothetical protein
MRSLYNPGHLPADTAIFSRVSEGLHPHMRWTKTPDFVHVYRGISPMNRVFFLTSAVCLVRLTQARRVFHRGQHIQTLPKDRCFFAPKLREPFIRERSFLHGRGIDPFYGRAPGSMRREPRPGLSVNPSIPCCRNRCPHLYTKRRLIPTVAATSEIDMPSATSKIIRPRRARPAAMVVERCHARRVWRSAGVRRIVREVLRPRAILIPHREENMGPVSMCQRGQTLP